MKSVEGGEAGGREIRKFKIAVTTDCTLRCAYCRVDKNLGQTISSSAALKALDFFLGSPGSIKKLEIYGGEALLKFGLAARIIDGALEKARRLGKNLAISLATNGVRADRNSLLYLKSKKVHLSVSFSGTGPSHDLFRKFPGGGGSFGRISGNVPLLLGTMGRENVDALFCVHPSRAGAAAGDFKGLAGLGFTGINIEIIHGAEWTRLNLEELADSLEKIGGFILETIKEGRPVFLEPAVAFLQGIPPENDLCPFFRDLEVLPGGEYSFYPFAFITGLETRKIITVGTVAGGLAERYRNCRFDPAAPLCRNCAREYYVIPEMARGNEAYALRTAFSRDFMKRLLLLAGKDREIRKYVIAAKKRSTEGFR